MHTNMITIRPIGYVRRSQALGAGVDELRRVPVKIIVNPELVAGLMGIERFDQLVVIFYCHRTEECALRVHPRGDRSQPERGVFASRSPARPNPLGLTVVSLLGVEGNVLCVRGLDALDGTPILDIKPFDQTYDQGKERGTSRDPRRDVWKSYVVSQTTTDSAPLTGDGTAIDLSEKSTSAAPYRESRRARTSRSPVFRPDSTHKAPGMLV